MAYDNSHVWAVGEILTAANFGTYLRDNITWLYDLLIAHKTRHENTGADEISVAGLSGLLADDQNPVVHGAGQHTDVTRELFIPANAAYTDGTPTLYFNYGVISLVDASTKKIYFTFKIPDNFVSFSSLKLVWASGAASGNMYWALHAYYGAPGEPCTQHQEDQTLGTTATAGASRFNEQEPSDALTLADIAAGDYVGVIAERQGGHASDTLNADVVVFGILFTYVGHQ